MLYQGGCRCGAVRYRIDGEPLSTGFCRCRMCRRVVGTPVAAWVAFPRAAFRFVEGDPRALKASPRAVRHVCAACGSAMALEYSVNTDTVDVAVASLDEPGAPEPLREIWAAARAMRG